MHLVSRIPGYVKRRRNTLHAIYGYKAESLHMYLASCTLGYRQSPYRSNKHTHMNCLFDCGCITQGLAFLIHQPNDASAGVYVYTYIHFLYTIILTLSIIIILHALSTVNQSVQHHYTQSFYYATQTNLLKNALHCN